MKIICFLFDSNVGGATVRARQVYQKMIAKGDKVEVVFPRGEGNAREFLREGGIPTSRLEIHKPTLPRNTLAFLKFALSVPIALIKTVQFLKKSKPDVIHVNGAFDIIPALSGRLTRTPVVWNLNDTVFSPRLSAFLGKIVYRVADIVAIAAHKVGTHYSIPPEDSMILYEPVDTERFKARDPDYLPSKNVVIGQLANWNWIKGQDRVIQVLENLNLEDKTLSARFIGKLVPNQEGYWQPILDDVKRRGLNDRIEVIGYSDEIPLELEKMDIAVLPSRSEACPLCVLEAMAIGVPQVVFDVGGVRELIGEGDNAAGIIVPEGDVGAMTAAIKRILSTPDLYHFFAGNGQRRARKEFSLAHCVTQHKLIYQAAIEKQRNR